MPLLSNLKIAKTISVKQTLVNLIAEQAELDDEFLPSPDNVAGFLQCVRLALPYFSAYIGSTPFANYICLLVITKLKEIEELEGGAELSLDIIKLLAELSPFSLRMNKIKNHCPEFLTAADNAQRFRDLKARLQFLARGVQSGIKTFRESLVSNKSKETKAEETKMKAIALRTMNNINTLIKDLFRTPPTFKTCHSFMETSDNCQCCSQT
ncbi:apoptosis inhibitor 5 [Caerostris extrusa]|uniref:Apoptosis inhibitor 5 n=1 Tax=Caerostris extrusa TaxID=172846 RepID=A0AAV4W9H7_CAEEX|nr:apoptosis inhibitor 5 [Caerostris extrusa]